MYRNYQKDYHTLFGNAFGEAAGANNEAGLYLGLRTSLTGQLLFEGYADFFRHNWLRFLVDAPSRGTEYFAKLTYSPTRSTELYLRMKHESKQRNTPDNETAIDYLTYHKKSSVRLHLAKRMSYNLTLRSRVEFSFFNTDQQEEIEHGYLLYQDIIYSFPRFPLRLSGRFAIFETAFSGILPGRVRR